MSRFKLVAFDLDGVLTDFISSWVWVHQHFGVDNETGYQLFMQKKIDDLEFMRMDIALWLTKNPELTEDEVRTLLGEVPLIPGARETIAALKEHGITTAIISGGLDLLAGRVARELKIDHVFANGLETREDGRLTGNGRSGVPLRRKDLILRKLQDDLGIRKEETVAVGDTIIDIPLFQEAGLAIAFNTQKEELFRRADRIVYRKDLREILTFIL